MRQVSESPDPRPRPPSRDWPRLKLSLQEALDGRYAIRRELGRGGMGIVILAWDPRLDRKVALKLLPPELASQERRVRFLREARIAAGLSHPNIVPIFTVDEAGPFVYFTMEYVPGETLAQRIRNSGPLPAGDVTRILHDVALAVDYAHRQGVIHRDLKPHNILMEKGTDRPMVTDFGIAEVVSESGGTGERHLAGTIAYVSPEQAQGEPADARSDIYALGVVGYIAASGRLPFTGSTVREILNRHISEPAPRLDVTGLHKDVTLARVVERCLTKAPAARFQTGEELATALSRAPELRRDLPDPLNAFILRVRDISRNTDRLMILWLTGSVGGLSAAASAAWGPAALAGAFVAALTVAPLLAILPVTRQLLAQGFTRADFVHVLMADLDRQRRALASQRRRDPGPADGGPSERWVAGGLGLFAVGMLMAISGLDVPEQLVMGSILLGALSFVVAGLTAAWQAFRRGARTGHRWLRFWNSGLGEWFARLAGIGLTPQTRLVGRLSSDLTGVMHLTESCIRRILAWLAESSTSEGRDPPSVHLSAYPPETERQLKEQLAALQATLVQFMGVDAAAADPGSLTADLDAARAICEAVEQLLDGQRDLVDGL